MQNKKNSIIKYIAAFIICSAFVFISPVIAKAGELTMHTINVFHGDAILIESAGHYMLVDSGYADNSEMLMNYLAKLDIPEKNIDYVVATHPDGDHIGGFSKVYDEYNIGNTILNDISKPIKAYTRFVNAMKEEGTPFHNPVDGESWKLGDALVTVVYDGRQGTTYNESSIVLKVTIDNKSILLTGDMPTTIEDKLILSKANLSADILKVGHHGASLSTSSQFLKKVKPSYAVISSAPYSADNALPKNAVLKRLAKVYAKTYRTTDGDIVINIKNGVISTDHPENNPYVCITKSNLVLSSTLLPASDIAGTPVSPSVGLYVNGRLMDSGKYNVSYADNTHTGTASVRVTGNESGTTEKLTGSLTSQFNILPRKTKIYSAKRCGTGNKVALHWNAQKTCSGYEIRYSTDKSFKTKTKTVKIKSGTTNKKTIKSLSKWKTYYFKVSAYTKDIGYGAWSAKAKVKKLKKPKAKKVVKKTKK